MKQLATAVAVLAFAACSGAPRHPAERLTVMTRNVYLGADFRAVMAARADSVPIQAALAWRTLVQTNFPERAGALAREIAEQRPHVVGLQEVVIFRTQDPGDLAAGGGTPAIAVAYDFLAIILDSLRAQGAPYAVGVADTTSDVEVPAVSRAESNGTPHFTDIRFTDRDVILVRSDVGFSTPRGARYAAHIPLKIAGMDLGLYRGWCSVAITTAGRTFRFVNTHLEDFSAEVQNAQATELLAVLRGDTLPVVVVGDLNSDADTTRTATYGKMTRAGFTDAWKRVRPNDPGYSCCQSELLSDAKPLFDQRIDLVLLKGPLEPVRAELVGSTATSRTRTGLWPSDHAGLVVGIR